MIYEIEGKLTVSNIYEYVDKICRFAYNQSRFHLIDFPQEIRSLYIYILIPLHHLWWYWGR